MSDLSPEHREMAHRIYPKIIAALNEERAPNVVAFSVLGVVLSQCVLHAAEQDASMAHRMVDEFSKSTHDIVNQKLNQ